MPLDRSDLRELLLSAAWAPLAVLVLHAWAGAFFGHEPWVDPIAHCLGGAAIAFFVRRAAGTAREALGAISPLGLDLLAFGLAVSAAVAWELGELASDLFLGTRIQVDARNVLRDLALGAAGAIAYVAASRVTRRSRVAED